MQIIDEQFQNYNLKVKGWAISGQAPPEEISDDLRTVQIAGITWETETDSFNLNHPPLHFGKKVRGRFPSDLKIYRRGIDTIEEFVGDTVLTRRIITSKLMCRFDLLGREVPLTARFKQDLRKLIKFYPLWDQPVSEEFRMQWIGHFVRMDETRDHWFSRSVVPEDALDCRKMRILILVDAANGGMD